MAQWLRSLAFVIQMYMVMALMALVITPVAMVRIEAAYLGIRAYCKWVRWTAHWMIGLKSEVRGEIPAGEVLICSKHQSFFDILMICSVVIRPRFVMKRSLTMTPIVGYYARRIGCIPIDRGKGAIAIRQLRVGLKTPLPQAGPLIIYPQGTRVAPGTFVRYKQGAAVLYGAMGSRCIPAATNVGVFWPRMAIGRKPGTAVVEFLPSIEPGLSSAEFLAKLETTVEDNSDKLMREAGFGTATRRVEL